ncbi:zinc finger HIT domain-containing protein [bacterium]|nr:zinc finger HIT domain-containing protein [bacterium]MDB9924622.1 zinc finger HIT domain-containing protein [bacterium]
MGKVLKRKKGKGGTRTTRGAKQQKRGPRSFAALLDEAMLDRVPPEIPTYATAAAGPSTTSAPRKFCSVCGFKSVYNCARCGMRFCCRKCNAVHTETRCLKMVG